MSTEAGVGKNMVIRKDNGQTGSREQKMVPDGLSAFNVFSERDPFLHFWNRLE